MKKIIVYSTNSCAFCKTEKQWLDSLGYTYESKMVDEDPEAMAELMELGVGTAVPVTVIDGEVVRGFQRQKIQALL